MRGRAAAGRSAAAAARPTPALREVLRALERGAVPAAVALRAALHGARSFTRWVGAHEPGWSGAPERRPSVRGLRVYPSEVVAGALELARARFLDRPGVLHVHWGLARRDGRSTQTPGVVVTVQRKLPSPEAGERLDRWLRLAHRGRRLRVRVDVQPAASPGALQSLARVGNHTGVRVGGYRGALGAVVDFGDGRLRAVLSGHVARRVGLRVQAETPGGEAVPLGQIEKVVVSGECDGATAGPLEADGAARVACAGPAELYEVGEGDLNTAIWIQTAHELAPRKAFITDVGAVVPFGYEDGVRDVGGLVGTSHQVTEAGDSGAPAVDLHGRLVGFVLGSYDGRTYLLPARRTLDDLKT